ncbi:MAG: hypothetical protein ABL994_24680 [Verrucomicrobiales bacterium]
MKPSVLLQESADFQLGFGVSLSSFTVRQLAFGVHRERSRVSVRFLQTAGVAEGLRMSCDIVSLGA